MTLNMLVRTQYESNSTCCSADSVNISATVQVATMEKTQLNQANYMS